MRLEVRPRRRRVCQRSSTLPQRGERERGVNEDPQRTSGLRGPLESVMNDPSITASHQPATAPLRRERADSMERRGGLADEKHMLQIVKRMSAGRTARGRDQPMGGQPAARRQPTSTPSYAAGTGGPSPWCPSPSGSAHSCYRTCWPTQSHDAEGRVLALASRPLENPRIGRHRQRQDDPLNACRGIPADER